MSGTVIDNQGQIVDAQQAVGDLTTEINIQNPTYSYYNINDSAVVLGSSSQDLGEFTVCAGESFEFWLSLQVTGIDQTQMSQLQLIAVDASGDPIDGPLVESSIEKLVADSSAEQISLFFKRNQQITDQRYKIVIGAIVNMNMPTIEAQSLQWGYKTYPMNYPMLSDPNTLCV